MGTRETDQPPLWIATSDLPTSPGHPFYARLTTLLDGHHFDRFVEGLCDRFYAPVMGRPSLAPGRYFRLLLVGYFEGIDSERGMAWRATDSLAVRSFLRLAVDEAPPDHSTIARTRRLIDLETHRTVFTWVQQRLVEAGRLKGKTIAIDATTLEANAAMRSIVRRDTGESYQAFLAGLAKASGIETPTREGLARLDRKRKKKKTSNTDWTNPHDPDAKVTKMKDGRTHLAHKAEHAVDMETGAIVAVTLQGADVGDTTTIIETAIAAAEQVEDAQANVDDRQSLEEIVGDKGYHSNQTLIDLDAVGIRSYVSEPDRGRRDWSKDPEARAPVYGNRRRMRGRRGRRLMRQRGERIERSFAHLYDTGGMRRTHLRGHTNILKRLLIHAGGFNLGLVMRHLIGIGTPRGLQGRVAAVLATLGVLMGVVRRRLTTISSSHRLIPAVRGRLASLATFAVNSSAAITCTTGCYGRFVDERYDDNAAVEQVAVGGPYSVAGSGDTPSRREIFVCRPTVTSDETACAERILGRLARRAYRRPVTDGEVATLMDFYRSGRRDGDFDAGIQFALERMLVDPEFLFRIERDPADILPSTPYPLDDLALASRLSFFLWSSIPDDELLEVATSGELSDPAVLEQQTRRLLADPRSRALVDNFVSQWLRLRNLESQERESAEYPEFDENLRQAFRRETELFVESTIREDRSLLELLSANYTFVNERLARHYGIRGVYGDRFRRVTLGRDHPRGGLLGHGGLLMVTSHPNRTSPVLRGKWLLESMLGAPPPEPPADVPGLPDRGEGGEPASVRDRLEQHRANPVCASCHAPMDPLGFALENFDAIGSWRATSEAGLPIDASGTMPSGAQFDGPAGLRRVLLGRGEAFADTVTEKLLAYAVGRGLEYSDRPSVRQVLRDAAPEDYRWSSIVLGIVKSPPFQWRRSRPDVTN